MKLIENIKQRAKENLKTIILPESEDKRVLEAASKVVMQGFANIILLGDESKIKEDSKKFNINLEGITIVNPKTSSKSKEYKEKLYELRKHKGLTIEQAEELIKQPIYFGMMMLKDEECEADGLVSGGENGTFIFGDSGLNQNPTADELSEIAISSSKSFKQLVGAEPKVAMLSYSTYGSAKSELTEKVVEATKLVKEKAPNLCADGELQLDAAIIPEIAKSKAPGSKVAGNANVLIFPDLNAGNIGYKLVQRLAKAEAYGPLCQGIAKPVNDLSRGCSADDIVGVVAITAVQSATK